MVNDMHKRLGDDFDNIHVKSLQFKGVHRVILSSVKVTLSDGTESPVFESKSCSHNHVETLRFEESRPVKHIAAQDGPILRS